MISYVSQSQKSNLIKEEDVNKIVRSPIFQRKNFELLQKQEQTPNLFNKTTEFFNSTPSTTSSNDSNVAIGGSIQIIKKSHNCGNLNEKQKSLIQNVSLGLENPSLSPKLSNQGEGGGVYFMSRNSNTSPVGVFKPRDEENGLEAATENGADTSKIGMKSGTLPGEGPFKEVAVYMFDQLHGGLFKVPTTTLVEIRHPTWNMSKKVGSLQEFIVHQDTAEEIGSSKFSTEDIHRIGLLDCLIFNCDRHFGNILAISQPNTGEDYSNTEEYCSDCDSDDSDDSACSCEPINNNRNRFFKLIPIDHSLCLPHSDYMSDAWFDWINYPQSKEEFSDAFKELVMSIDPDSDIQQLHSRLPKLKLTSLETLKISTLFVKSAITNGLTLHQIGKLMSRFDHLDKPSALESLINQTKLKLNLRSSTSSSSKPLKLYNQLFWSTFQDEINQFFKKR